MKDQWSQQPKDEAIKTAELMSPYLREILGREFVGEPTAEQRQQMSASRVLVTGAAGSIGWVLSEWLNTAQPERLILLDNHENSLFRLRQHLSPVSPNPRASFVLADVRNRRRMESILSEYRPDIILHLAAYKHVPMAEEWPQEFVQINVLGTWQLANMATQWGVKKFVYTSSDKAVNPPSIYGATKRVSEVLLRSLAHSQHHTQFTIARLVNVLGARGGVIETFSRDILGGRAVRLTDPRMTRYWITMPEVLFLIIAAAGRDASGDIVLLDSGQPISLPDMARRIWKLVADPGREFTAEHVGIRPGERLHEELAYSAEKLVPTAVPGLVEAVPGSSMKQATLEELIPEVANLRRLADESRSAELVKHLFALVKAFS